MPRPAHPSRVGTLRRSSGGRHQPRYPHDGGANQERCQWGIICGPRHSRGGQQFHHQQHHGDRLRLKASFDITGFSAANQVILKAMQNYGLIVADNGSNMFFQGAPDARWDDNDWTH